MPDQFPDATEMIGPGTIGPGPHGSALWVIAQIRDIVGDHKCGLTNCRTWWPSCKSRWNWQ